MEIGIFSKFIDDGDGVLYGLREVVKNGDFSSDTFWTKGVGFTISGGLLVATAVAANVYCTQVVLSSGKKYKISFEISGYVSGSIGVGDGASSVAGSANGVFTGEITAVNNTIYIWVTGAGTFNLDKVSFKTLFEY